jgi:hypothetical protein
LSSRLRSRRSAWSLRIEPQRARVPRPRRPDLCDRLELRAGLERGEDRPDVVADRGFGDPEARCDDFGGHAVGQKPEDLLLPRRERDRHGAWRRRLVLGHHDVKDDGTATVVHRDRGHVDTPLTLSRLDEQALAGDRPAFAGEARGRAPAVAHEVAARVVSAEHLPAIATDRFVSGDPPQLLRRPVPRDDLRSASKAKSASPERNVMVEGSTMARSARCPQTAGLLHVRGPGGHPRGQVAPEYLPRWPPEGVW